MKTETVVVANGVFTPDQVIAVALSKFVEPLDIIRTRDEEIMDSAGILIGIGGKYDPNTSSYDYHQFIFNDPYYGFSSSSLIWKNTRDYFKSIDNYKAISDVDDLIEAVANREIPMPDSKGSSIYDGLLNSIVACNNIEPFSEEQDNRFTMIVEDVVNIIDALAKGETALFTSRVVGLEALGLVYMNEKDPIFLAREKAMRVIDGVLVSKFFPTWRSVSKKQGKPLIMPGDKHGEYKVMMDTSKDQLIAVKNCTYLHKNGFTATCRPDGNNVGIATLGGKLYEVNTKKIEEVLTNS